MPIPLVYYYIGVFCDIWTLLFLLMYTEVPLQDDPWDRQKGVLIANQS